MGIYQAEEAVLQGFRILCPKRGIIKCKTASKYIKAGKIPLSGLPSLLAGY